MCSDHTCDLHASQVDGALASPTRGLSLPSLVRSDIQEGRCPPHLPDLYSEVLDLRFGSSSPFSLCVEHLLVDFVPLWVQLSSCAAQLCLRP